VCALRRTPQKSEIPRNLDLLNLTYSDCRNDGPCAVDSAKSGVIKYMDNRLEKIIQVLQEKAGASYEEFRGEVHIFIGPEQIVDALTFLRDEHAFSLLSALTAVDYWPQENPRFHVIYQLTSLTNNMSVQLRVPVNGGQPSLPTATSVFEVANWREREIADMFGVEFVGHPDPRRILMPEDWDGHPLRKDYPLGYEEPQFTFNFEEIDLRKPYVKE
jgi:NADH-quinone oxidoreductase subunit C